LEYQTLCFRGGKLKHDVGRKPIRLHDQGQRDDLLFHWSASGKQSRHLDDGCVEEVEGELRREAEYEHEN
jgi:hypothetical protein